jgi:hypothetical protein
MAQSGKFMTNALNQFNDKEILDLAMHDHGSMNLYRQRSPRETFRARDAGRTLGGKLDSRWKSLADVES